MALAKSTTERPSAYLTLYNTVQFLGWNYILYISTNTTLQGGSSSDVWKAVQLPLEIFQTAAVLEVFHCMLGLVRAPVMTTAMQVASRIWVLWGIVYLAPDETTRGAISQLGPFSPTFTSLVTAWAFSEIMRYGFFAARALGSNSYALLWLRYTGFIALYPIGVGSELAMAALALQRIKQQKLLSLALPNAINFVFDYHIACIILMLVYIPGFPHMYFHMMRQRGKYLGKAAQNSRKKLA